MVRLHTDDAPAPEVVVVHSPRVSCGGVGGALGHPRVWLEMGEEDHVECGYCDRRFVRAGSPEARALKEPQSQAPGVYESASGH